MNGGPATINVAPRFAPSAPDRARELSLLARQAIRILSFAALALYGVVRWATLVNPAPTARLLGLFGVAVVLTAVVPLLRRLGRLPALTAVVALCLLALPVAGLPWHDFIHVHIAVSAREVGNGLSGLPGSYVPYSGTSHAVRLVITLGAAVLLLDGAVVLAFAPSSFGDGRRAGAALPLIALAVVPSALVRPSLPYLQGLLLFALLVAFVWGERARREGAGAAIVLLAVAGLAGAIAAPRIDEHRPWVDYRAWAGTLVRPREVSFAWNQGYGPLRWPRTGHVVLSVTAARGDYWKAEDLDVFNGTGWAQGAVSQSSLPAPRRSALKRWSQTIQVVVNGLRSAAMIASGYAARPSEVRGGVTAGVAAGTWVATRPLTPGDSYIVRTYSPHPTATQLAHAGRRYPQAALDPYRSLALPVANGVSQVTFPAFGSHGPSLVPATLRTSVYAPVYALARRLSARARTPYAYAQSIMRYLSSGYAYNENPPVRRYPLVSFLFRDKVGYCQQFSGAMALLLRMGGVPARVSAGFTAGSQATGDRWLVTDIDAHAWVEAWFPRYGWVRFDPTPSVAPARGGNTAIPFVKNLPGAGHAAVSAARRDAGAVPVSTTRRAGGPGGGLSPWLVLPLVIAAGGLIALAVVLIQPELGPEDRLRELERALSRTGRPLGSDVTLAMLERRFRDSPPAAGYIRALRLARYGGGAPAPEPTGRRALREQLRQGLGLAGRLRALWALPPRPGLRLRRRRGGLPL